MASNAVSPLCEQGFPTEKVLLVPGHGKGQAGFDGRVLSADVVSPMAKAFFQPAPVERIEAAQGETAAISCLQDRLQEAFGVLDGYVQLEPKLAHIADARRPDVSCGQADAPRRAERKGRIG